MPAVRASGLVKHFETTCALDRVDLKVEAGEVRGLLGPNGAGKTTQSPPSFIGQQMMRDAQGL